MDGFILQKLVLAEMSETVSPSGKEIGLQFYGSFSFLLWGFIHCNETYESMSLFRGPWDILSNGGGGVYGLILCQV